MREFLCKRRVIAAGRLGARKLAGLVAAQALRLPRQVSGTAAVELALLLPLMIAVLAALANIGVAFQAKVGINSALSTVSYYVFSKGQSLSSATAATFDTNVKKLLASLLPSQATFTTTILYNGSTSASEIDNYYCVSSTSPPTFTKAAGASTTCATNIKAGKYITISIQGSVAPVFPATAFLGDYFAVAERTHVRIK